MQIDFSQIGNVHLRQQLQTACSPAGLELFSELAIAIYNVLRKHFQSHSSPTVDWGFDHRCYSAQLQPLAETIERIAGVESTVAFALSAHIARNLAPAHEFNCSGWMRNQTETQASLASLWDQFTEEALHCGNRGTAKGDEIVEMLLQLIEKLAPDAFSELPTGRQIVRAREWNLLLNDQVSDLPAELGAPPRELAVDQRASPRRVSCFYGADDIDTCLSELRLQAGRMVWASVWETTQPIRVLDLNSMRVLQLPTNVFDSSYEQTAIKIGLIRGLSDDFSQPSWQGEDESHYASTQYFAEYCRRLRRGSVDGLIYPSTQRPGGVNYAFFGYDRQPAGTGFLKLIDDFGLRVTSTSVTHRAVDFSNFRPRASDSV